MAEENSSLNREAITAVIFFDSAPDHYEAIISALKSLADDVICGLDGFFSIHIHGGCDKDRVAAYTQWDDEQSARAMLENDKVRECFDKLETVATKNVGVYEVLRSFEPA